jgi:hypothetical protein
MRIDFNRMSKLAGLPTNNRRSSGRLNENADHGGDVDEMEGMMREMEDTDETMESDVDEMEAMMSEMEDSDEAMEPDMDEMIEVDEAMLVQELRRAKRIMESRKRRALTESRNTRQKNIFEAQLKKVIDEEVANVMEELNLTGGWVYGDNKPKRSRRGYTHQGGMLPGLGFRRY